MSTNPDLLIVGGGAVGLATADAALRRGLRVTLLERAEPGREASWAGAGMLTCRPWPKREPGVDYHDLTQLSVGLHRTWAARLREETGIDVGYRACGAMELFFQPGEHANARQREHLHACNERGIPARMLGAEDARRLEPGLAPAITGVIEYPEEAQVRNPRFIRALLASVERRGGVVRTGSEMAELLFSPTGERVEAVRLTNGETIPAGAVVLATGAWTGALARAGRLGTLAPRAQKIEPVRGQLLRYEVPPDCAKRLLTTGNQYIVPRGDGVLLVGATHEHTGFEKETTVQGRDELQAFARSVLPLLGTLQPVQQWSGLRPGLKGKHPLLGRVPGTVNVYLNAGHYRNGLTLAPGCAELVAGAVQGEQSELLAGFQA